MESLRVDSFSNVVLVAQLVQHCCVTDVFNGTCSKAEILQAVLLTSAFNSRIELSQCRCFPLRGILSSYDEPEIECKKSEVIVALTGVAKFKNDTIIAVNIANILIIRKDCSYASNKIYKK